MWCVCVCVCIQVCIMRILSVSIHLYMQIDTWVCTYIYVCLCEHEVFKSGISPSLNCSQKCFTDDTQENIWLRKWLLWGLTSSLVCISVNAHIAILMACLCHCLFETPLMADKPLADVKQRPDSQAEDSPLPCSLYSSVSLYFCLWKEMYILVCV